MQREYHKWHSPHLSREMEMLVFGTEGARALIFPTRSGRFFDFEDWGLVGAASGRIEAGELQLFCVDSVDNESLYAEPTETPPRQRIQRHLDYQQYLTEEVIPFTSWVNPSPDLIAAGCSLGAYHAVNIALRYPERFRRVVALSGRYDLTVPTGPYRDLFEGYFDEDVYFNNPAQFLGNMWDETILNQLRRLHVILAVGVEDACYASNCLMAELLARFDIPRELYLWEGEAHRARYWRRMIAEYL